MKIPFIHQRHSVTDKHEKPWGGFYARRLWRIFLGFFIISVIISGLIQYRLHSLYTQPIVVSTEAITKQIVVLDMAGLAKAVEEIKNKETRFNQYLKEKIDISDPAK